MDVASYSSAATADDGSQSYAYYYGGSSLVYNSDWPEVFLVYLAYFAGVCILAAILDGSRVFDGFVSRLGKSAFTSFESYERLVKARQESADRGSLNFDGEKKFAEIREDVSKEEVMGENKDQNRCWKQFVKYVFCHLPSEEFSFEFFEELLETENYFFGCEDLYHKGGFVLGCLCWKNIYTFPVGMMEDFYYYLCNNHSMLSMVLATRGNPFTRAKRRLAFFGQNCFALFCQVFLKLITNNQSEVLFINIFILSPLVIAFNQVFYYLLVCPCLLQMQRNQNTKGCFSAIAAAGIFLSIPVTLFTILLLLFCAIYSGHKFSVAEKTISNYAWSIHIIAAIEEVMWYMLKFLGGTQGTFIRACGTDLLCFGSWYSKKIEKLFLVKDKDYVEKEWHYCCFTWTVQCDAALYNKTLQIAQEAKRNISVEVSNFSAKLKKSAGRGGGVSDKSTDGGRTASTCVEGEPEAIVSAVVDVSVDEEGGVTNPINAV